MKALVFEQYPVMKREVRRCHGGYIVNTFVYRCGKWWLAYEKPILDIELLAIRSLKGDEPICTRI